MHPFPRAETDVKRLIWHVTLAHYNLTKEYLKKFYIYKKIYISIISFLFKHLCI